MSLGKSNQGSSQSFDPELKGLLTSTFRTGQALSQTPYSPYNFATVAPLAPAQLEGMNAAATAARGDLGRTDLTSAINATRGIAQRGLVNPDGTIANVGTVAATDVTADPNISSLSTTFTAPTASAITAPTVAATNVGYNTLQSTDLTPYQNTFQTEVIDAALGDIERARQSAQNQNAARAVAAGAFGGDRQAVLEGQTNEAFARQAANTAANLRQQGFQSARQAALQDAANKFQADRANQAAGLDASRATGQLGVQAGSEAARLGLQGAIAGMDATQRAELAKAQMGNQLALANQEANLRAALANQQAQMGLAGQNLQGAQQLANLAQTERALDFADAQALTDVGAAQRAAASETLADRLRRFEERRDFPLRMFDVLRAGAGVLPNPLTSSSRGRQTSIGIGS